jgi:hypothetical protein
MVELGSLLADYPCDKADFNKTSCKEGATCILFACNILIR